jgi:hypothetical protein
LELHLKKGFVMPKYRMSFESCNEIFPGDRRYRQEQPTFDAASDKEATQRAEEIACEHLNLDNRRITYRLEEYREVGTFSKTFVGEGRVATPPPKVTDAGYIGADRHREL